MMQAWQPTVIPRSSLFLARERGNRAIRRSFPYIPATTASGALNTRLHQLGWKGTMYTFRFGNLYPALDDQQVWLPAPRTLYRCPACSQFRWMQALAPAEMANEMLCDVCGALRRPAEGFVAARLTPHSAQPTEVLRQRVPALNAQLSGRVALHRRTGGQMDGQLHFVEVLRVRGLPFRGTAWLEPDTIQTEAEIRLMMGGLRSRGSGRVTLRLEALPDGEDDNPAVAPGDRLWVETPTLPLPAKLEAASPLLTARVVSPYARVEVCERWAAKPLVAGKGLVSFLDTLAVGSVLTVSEGTAKLGPGIFFYGSDGIDLALYYLEPPFDDEPVLGQDYSLVELWTLGFGQLRRLEGVA
jgi:hypothetical protein